MTVSCRYVSHDLKYKLEKTASCLSFVGCCQSLTAQVPVIYQGMSLSDTKKKFVFVHRLQSKNP